METSIATQANYSLKEKYFQIEPEMRIGRGQYFVRMSVMLGGLFLFLMIPNILAFAINPFFILMPPVLIFTAIFGIIQFILLYRVGIVLATKRCYDFGNDGKIARSMIYATLILSIIISIFGLMMFIPGFPTVVFIIINLIFILKIMYIALCILILFLIFRPGISGDNMYGKDTINTKVKFLG